MNEQQEVNELARILWELKKRLPEIYRHVLGLIKAHLKL
jgi:hypothetical protein